MTESFTPDDFFDAMDRGDAVAAAKVLRQLDGLSRSSLDDLADLFHAVGPNVFPSRYRIKLVYAGNGRPPKMNQMDKRFLQRDMHHEVRVMMPQFKKEMAAIKAAAEKNGWEEPTVRKAYYAVKKRIAKNSPKSP